MTQLRAGIIVTDAAQEEAKFVTSQYAVVYIGCGRGTYVDGGGQEHALEPGVFFQRFPDRPHTVRLEAPIVRCHIAVPWQAWDLMKLTSPWMREDCPVLRIGEDLSFFKRVHDLCEELRAAPEPELTHTLLKMLALIAELHARGRAQTGGQASTLMARARERLGGRFSERVALPALARSLGMSNSAFRRAFLRECGMAPGEYRVRRRVELAMERLMDRSRKACEIAMELGYPDLYAFSAQFKKHTGYSPRAFRLQCEGGGWHAGHACRRSADQATQQG